MTSNVEFRPATLEDALRFYKAYPPARFRGYVVEIDGNIESVFGIYYVKGYPVAFSDITDVLRKRKKVILTGIRILMQQIIAMKVPVYALASQREKSAPYLLAKMGFKPTGKITKLGEYLVREP